ncbi:MAG: hypothetical protein ABFS45_08645 [Pseudomonadota bacterium]
MRITSHFLQSLVAWMEPGGGCGDGWDSRIPLRWIGVAGNHLAARRNPGLPRGSRDCSALLHPGYALLKGLGLLRWWKHHQSNLHQDRK